jgi:hypothetical protein
MKKMFIAMALLAATSRLMAQNSLTIPDKKDKGLLDKQFEFKTDSSWKALPQFKGNTNLQNMIGAYNQPKLQRFNGEDNMPVAVLKGYSKMPVLKPGGNYNLPVAGKAPKRSPDVFVP